MILLILLTSLTFPKFEPFFSSFSFIFTTYKNVITKEKLGEILYKIMKLKATKQENKRIKSPKEKTNKRIKEKTKDGSNVLKIMKINEK